MGHRVPKPNQALAPLVGLVPVGHRAQRQRGGNRLERPTMDQWGLAATQRPISSSPITWPFGPSILCTSRPWRIKTRAWIKAVSLRGAAAALTLSLPRVMFR